MTSHRQRNDADRRGKRPFSKGPNRPDERGGERPFEGKREDKRGPRAPKGPGGPDGAEWLWGWHAVVAALANDSRAAPKRLLATPDRARQLTERFGRLAALEETDNNAIAHAVPANAVHQGVALKIPPLEPLDLEELAEPASGVILMLDQITDPQNVGAIFRSAAAFGARGLVLQDRHTPPLAGALAKAAAGAVDVLPHAKVVNLSRALEKLTDLGWRAVGLDSAATGALADVLDDRPTVIVLGSEGEGIRRLVAEHCDALALIPMPGGFESLNVSNAAAIAMYEATRKR